MGAARRSRRHRRDRCRDAPICGTCSRCPRSSTPIPSATARPGAARRAAPRLSGDAGDRARRSGPSSTGSAGEFPFYGSGVLTRLCVHPAIVDFMERALGSTDLRVYQAQVSAKYAGDANFEQPMHTDRNHSFLPPRMEPPWWHVESFLYLTDVDEGTAPTHLVRRGDAVGRSTNSIFMPDNDPELYASERAAVGRRGSLLVYRPDVFHRGVDLTRPGGHRFLLNVSYKVAGTDWIGFHSVQSNATHPSWMQFVESATPPRARVVRLPAARVTRCGRRRSSTRRRRSIRSSTSSLGGARFVDDRRGHGPQVAARCRPSCSTRST